MKEYKVDTGNQVSWHNTLDRAIEKYNDWIDFYYDNFKAYGDRIITLSIDNKIVYSCEISKDDPIEYDPHTTGYTSLDRFNDDPYELEVTQ